MFVVVVGVVATFIVRMNRYDKRIQERDDHIEMLKASNDSINISLDLAQEKLDSINAQIPLYADSIDNLVVQRTLLKRKYEKQISDILAIPVDSVYREVTRWLDER
jgi:chromosome segregation ATPase